MIYSLGIPKLSGVNMEFFTEQTLLHPADILLIDANGQRCIWDKERNTMRLKAIVPTLLQVDRIERYLHCGGRIFTSMVDPSKPQDVFATFEEVDGYRFQPPYAGVSDESLIKISIPPYNWVPSTYTFVPSQAYEFFQSRQNNRRTVENDHFTYVIAQSVDVLTYFIGENGGSITFSTLLGGSMKQHDVTTLLTLGNTERKGQVSVQ